MCLYCEELLTFVLQGCVDTEFNVQGLSADKEYLFRVAAVNSNGPGDYLTTSTPVAAKYPFGKLNHIL